MLVGCPFCFVSFRFVLVSGWQEVEGASDRSHVLCLFQEQVWARAGLSLLQCLWLRHHRHTGALQQTTTTTIDQLLIPSSLFISFLLLMFYLLHHLLLHLHHLLHCCVVCVLARSSRREWRPWRRCSIWAFPTSSWKSFMRPSTWTTTASSQSQVCFFFFFSLSLSLSLYLSSFFLPECWWDLMN